MGLGIKVKDLNREDFANTSTLFAFQLEPTFPDDPIFLSLMKTGHVRLDVPFENALTETISCIVYSESPGVFFNNLREILLQNDHGVLLTENL